MPVVLLIRENEDLHSVLLSNKALILGRSSSCDVRLSDDRVSGKHLAIKLSTQGKVMIKDMSTTNGSFLNGSQIQESFLMLKDELLIGSVLLTLDPSQLNPKEKIVLTREDATQMKFIKLNTQTDSRISENQKPGKPISAAPVPEERSPTLIFNAQGEAIIPQDEAQQKPEAKSTPEDRAVAKAHNARKIKSGTESALVSDEPQFEMEKSSGKTQMIRIDKPELKESQHRKALKKKRPIKQKEAKPVSLLARLLSFFKKA